VSRVRKPPILDRLPPEKGVIQASAGTGKTYLLERIVIDLVLQGFRLEEILVVTFTEKATLELKARIRAMLERMAGLPGDYEEPGEPAWVIDPAGVRALQAALRGFERATIATIHGFCRRVLQECAFEGGALLRQELADGRALLGRAWREVVRRDGGEPALGAYLRELVGSGWSFENLEELLWSAHAERGLLLPEPGGDPEAVLAAYPDGWERRWPELDRTLAGLDLHPATRRALRSRLEGLFALMADRPTVHGAVSGWDFGYLEEQRILARGGAGHELFEWLAAFARAAGNPEALAVHRLLPRVRDRLRVIKDAEGRYDHDDTILQVQAALAGPRGADLAARLRERYRAALIDEFQDTDQAQWAIFRSLFGDPGHRLYVIGDPKQAIYGFRGGDLPTYRNAARALLGTDRPLELRDNHRSTRAVIAACNRIFTGGSRDPGTGLPVTAFFSDPDLYPPAAAVGCGKPRLATLQADGTEPAPVRVLRCATLDGGRRLWLQVARGLAREIKELVLGGLRFGDPEPAGPGQGLRPLHYGDVQVLVEKRRQGREIAEALAREGIPFSFFKQDGLLESPEALDLLDCLGAVLDPRDRTRLARALVTPLFGYGWSELEALADLAEDHPAVARLREWQALAQQRRFPQLFEAMLHGSGLIRRLRLALAGERSLTNFLHLTELLVRHARETAADLDDLVRLLKRWIAGTELPPGENGSIQRLEGERRAVQIMTMHQSKGLEAPIVALYGFTRPNTRTAVKLFHRDGRRCAYLGALPEAVKQEVDKERSEEAERLLYVALTRARAMLLLPCFVADRKGAPCHPGGHYAILNRRLREILEREADDGLFRVVPLAGPDAAVEAPEPAAELGGWTVPQPPGQPLPDYEAARRRARPPLTTSYTALHAFLHARKGGPEGGEEMVLDGEQEDAAAPPVPGELPRGARTGILLHRLLEQVDLAGAEGIPFEAWWADPARRAWIDQALAGAGLEAHQGPRAARMVYDALQVPLAGAPLGRHDHVLRELDFLARYLDTGGLFQGAMDVLSERDGRIQLVDWKSDALADYGGPALDARVRADYRVQVQIYLNVALDYFGVADEADYQRRFGALHYVFLRGLPGAGVWSWRPAWTDLLAWRRDLRALHDQVTAHD
jgi:exodeoxyribonuclease V beta subunit